MPIRRFILSSVVALSATACSSPIVKPDAFDRSVLDEHPLVSRLTHAALDGEEIVVQPSDQWMQLTQAPGLRFAGYRGALGGARVQPQGGERPASGVGPEPGHESAITRFAVVLECDPVRDLLMLLWLRDGETPLDVLASDNRRRQLEDYQQQYARHGKLPPAVPHHALSLRQVVRDKLLGPPIPDPARVIAVAANFPSHLECDLDVPVAMHARIASTPPRIFAKHPPVTPHGAPEAPAGTFRGIIGPFDDVVYPGKTQLPASGEVGSEPTDTALDYEVEVGIVLGRDLTWDDVREASDEDLWDAVAGTTLVSDIKARNPQVYERLLSRGQSTDLWSRRYLTGDAAIDEILGNWDAATCEWWGYAAGLGDLTAIGPYFVARDKAQALRPHPLLLARTYADSKERRAPIPGGRRAGAFYVRQCSVATAEYGYRDTMLWSIPDILRAALDPRGALSESIPNLTLRRGDVIALGTPGGISLTVANRGFYSFLAGVLFWWNARDWHDAFFKKDVPNYLHDGDELLLWGENLGMQRLTIRQLPGAR